MRPWWLVVWLLPCAVMSLFPGRAPDEGDVRHLYPVTQIALGVWEHAHSLPYLLGFLENIDYPKSRLHLEIYVHSKEDTTEDQAMWWKDSVTKLFASVKVLDGGENWMESALRSARLRKAARVLILNGDTVPFGRHIIQTLGSNSSHTVVSALLDSPFADYASNIAGSAEELAECRNAEAAVKFNAIALPVLIRLDVMDASYLTFDADNLPSYVGSGDPLEVATLSATKMGIELWLEGRVGGIYIDEHLEVDQKRELMRYWTSDRIASSLPIPPSSRTVRPWTPEPHLWNVDKIYLINLDRRSDRLKRMDVILNTLGVDYHRFAATDGHSLPSTHPYSVLPGYEDPFHKRPIKTGEIGCFLSHYRIWEEVVRLGLSRVIVFEDDLRFAPGGLQRIKDVLEDLDASKMPWDLVYLGRKKQAEQEELWIPNHRHLSSVGYSYWTLGYMLSLSGAEKLLAARPLEKLLPVDEYLPIMFDRHPTENWTRHFPIRNLDAFTMFPLVVSPQKYTTDVGYVSDTEDSKILEIQKDQQSSSKDEL